ncbi:NAD(P)H azoreductase [compost metagenome]
MKITITGSLGNIGRHLVDILIRQSHEVTVISSSPERASEIEHLGAKALIGSIFDVPFLTASFSGADAAFLMTPPNLGGQHIVENTANAGKAYATAIKSAGLKKIVMLSSVGAEFEAGTGPIQGLHQIEEIYKTLLDVHITFLRAGYFYTNFYNDIPLIKNAGIEGSNFPAEIKVPLVAPLDIATATADALQNSEHGHQVRYIVSDYASGAEIAQALGTAIEQPKLPWIEFTDEQALDGMLKAGLPAEIAELYVEMGQAIRSGKLQQDFENQGQPIFGKVKLNHFAIDFAKRF